MRGHSGLVAAVLCSGVSLAAPGAVVTDNNLQATNLGSLTAGPAIGSLSFNVSAGLYGVSATVASTATGYDMDAYNVDGISTVALPTAAADLEAYTRLRTGGSAYGPQLHMLRGAADTSGIRYYHLGMGRFDHLGAGNYQWSADNITLYSGAGADGGNLVPNASFEDTSISFWSGGSFVDDAGKHGSKVWQIDSQVDRHIAIPIVPGQEISYAFWAAAPNIGSGAQIEIGFSKPLDGNSVGTGNQAIGWGASQGNRDWTMFSGILTPEADQTTFYIGGMSNGGTLRFDSILVTQVPEPGAALGVMLLCGISLLRRKARQ